MTRRTGATMMTPCTWEARSRWSVDAMSLPLLLSVTKLSACPACRAAASIPKSMCDGPNCSVSTAITPSVRERPPARTRAAVLAW